MKPALIAIVAEAALRPVMPTKLPHKDAAPFDVVLFSLTVMCGALGAGAEGHELTRAMFWARAHAFLRGSR